MKSKIFGLMVASLPLCASVAQTTKDVTHQEYAFTKKESVHTLIVANINGSVQVKGYDGEKVVIDVEKIINAKTQERLAEGKEQTQFCNIDRGDSMIFYLRTSCNTFRRDKQGHWAYQWNNCDNCRETFDYHLNISIQVPRNCNVNVSTVNDGNLVVENIQATVRANNVNGDVTLTNINEASEAVTVNGNVDLNFLKNPNVNSRFYSLNGDINANFPHGLAANLSFESFNGNLYTNLDKLVPLPIVVENNSNGNGLRFKVKGTNYQIGKGGAHLDFETFNGNVYIKEVN